MSTVVSQLVEQLDGRPALVVGGGRMGLAIAHILATAGAETFVVEPLEAVRNAAGQRLTDISRARGIESVPVVTLVESIEAAPPTAALVIEAAIENLDVKRDIFHRLEVHLLSDAILATNTSVIPVGKIAESVVNRSRVVGTHFWNPPYLVRLVEVVQADQTSLETINRTLALMTAMGQEAVHVRKDIPGFIGNRLQHALKREAIALVQAGVCDAETVDTVVKKSFGARLGIMGPLEQSDLVGLNLTLAIHETVLADLDVSRGPQQILVDLVGAGKTGCAVGEGFRTWTPEARHELQTRLDRTLRPATLKGSDG